MVQWQSKEPCVYILASKRDGVLYIGVTSAIYDRMMRHRNGVDDGFTKRYGVHRLVYYEYFPTIGEAIARESRLKKWRRAWKVRLIHETNPEWCDLFDPEDGVMPWLADEARRKS